MTFEVQPKDFATQKLSDGNSQRDTIAAMLEKYPLRENEIKTIVKEAAKGLKTAKAAPVGYQPEPGEENTFVLEIEQRSFDSGTGKKISKPHLYKADERTLRNWLKNKHVTGYSINKVLWNPSQEPNKLEVAADSWDDTNDSAPAPTRTAADIKQ